MRHIEAVFGALIAAGAFSATKYVTPTHVIRATARRYRGKVVRDKGRSEFTVTIGRPNYREREFIKAAKKAGEPFPIRKVQVRLAPQPRTVKPIVPAKTSKLVTAAREAVAVARGERKPARVHRVKVKA